MKKSKHTECIGLDDYEKPLGIKGKAKLIGLASIPLVITSLLCLNEPEMEGYHIKSEPKTLKPYFENGLQKPEIPEIKPIFQKGDRLIQSKKAGGVVLSINGMDIHTGLSAEEVLEQLEIDYYDIFDYYGGAEELY